MKISNACKALGILLLSTAFLLCASQAVLGKSDAKVKKPSKPAAKSALKRSAPNVRGPSIQDRLKKKRKAAKPRKKKSVLDKNPGLEHRAGTAKGGTFILKHDKKKPVLKNKASHIRTIDDTGGTVRFTPDKKSKKTEIDAKEGEDAGGASDPPKPKKKKPKLLDDDDLKEIEDKLKKEGYIKDPKDKDKKDPKQPKPEPPKKDSLKGQDSSDLIDEDEGFPGYCDQGCKSFEECIEHQPDDGGSSN